MKMIFLLLLPFLLFGEEIRVQLTSDHELLPIYISQFLKEGEELSPQYLEELHGVLSFDLSYNGSTQVVSKNSEREGLLSKLFDASAWKQMGIAHVLQAKVSHKQLQLKLLSTQSNTVKNFEIIPLTGILKEDRRLIHKLADRIHRVLFNTEGVAHSRILYCVQMKNGQGASPWISEVWECDWDGANARQVTKESSYSVTPLFIPANPHYATDRFLYVSYKNGQPKIFIASLKEGKGERFIDIRGNQLLPAISSKRDKIAFICDASGRADLFLQPFDPNKGKVGKPYQLFSYPRSSQASPTFSPDGATIAFVSDKDGAPRIYTISATFHSKRATPTLITKKNPESSCPAWSPDGKKIAFSARTTGIRQIWIYDFETGEEKQLTFGPGNKENPSWAPDSLHLVFNSTDSDSSELYMVNLNQPEAIKISRGSGKKHYPSWGTR